MTHNTSPKLSILEPKVICLQTYYSITINPNDDYQFFNDIESVRIKKAENHIKYIMRKYINIRFSLYIDVSRVGRIHWHGTIMFPFINSIKFFYTEVINELLSKHHIEIDTINDSDKWFHYCTKTAHLWKVVINTDDLLNARLKRDLTGNAQYDITKYCTDYPESSEP